MQTSNFPRSVLFAQSTFRAVLDAMSRPGAIRALGDTVDPPPPFSKGAAAVALTLCDYDTPVWLDDALRANAAVGEWLRFHCGSPLIDDRSAAMFAFVADATALPSFEDFNAGTADYPDRGTTVVVQVETLTSGPELILEGPGINGRRSLRASSLPFDMTSRLARNRALFPRGIDLLLVAGASIAGLPRSVRVVED